VTKQKLPKSLKDLIKQGEEDGFLAQDVIFLIYSEPEKHLDEIDNFF
jgi:RNA polymerase primary sigma factor